MAQIVSTAVVQETVNKVLSNLVQKYEEREESSADRNMERLEMAHIRLEAVLETADKWQIADASLLLWRRKLKRAAQECDDTLHRCKQRILEDEETENEVRRSSFPKRIAHTAKSFVSSIFCPNKDESNSSAVRRFEWFADGGSEFLRLVELGGTPRRHMPFDPLIRHLLAGKKIQHRILQANGHPLFLLLEPYVTAEYGNEARLFFMQRDGKAPEDDFFLSIMLQISESTDIVGIAVKCLQLFTPLFKSTVETIREKLMQLPTEDFSWVPYVDTHHKEHWDNLHIFGTHWLRPNPLCCKQHDQHKLCHGRKLNRSRFPDASLEPVIEVHMLSQVWLSECNQHKALLSETRNSPQDSFYLKAGLLFAPHGEDTLPVDRSPAIAAIHSEEQHCLHTDFTLAQLQETVVPKAVDYFCKNNEATVYQMIWRSKHGTAYIHVEMASVFMQSARRMLRRKDQSENWSNAVYQFISLWDTHAPVEQQRLIKDWIHKERERQQLLIGAPPVSYKSCKVDRQVKRCEIEDCERDVLLGNRSMFDSVHSRGQQMAQIEGQEEEQRHS
ncbi:hypothetical protein BS78_02G017900 [Paspalum vaginatum]|nr:hypothetical protein BS78_02G017900 [Paspalum vaginatum]KAJ1287537.1 hypothetical protein BS78_02G017900 [Paspalum vaginatum]KAJ1287538.1 hypothetical protein BS78_02G017900 [Paspalum vaginatum]